MGDEPVSEELAGQDRWIGDLSPHLCGCGDPRHAGGVEGHNALVAHLTACARGVGSGGMERPSEAVTVMAKNPNKNYYYDPKRSAAGGRWIVVTKYRSVVDLALYHTEYEARKACGLRGGHRERTYVPSGT